MEGTVFLSILVILELIALAFCAIYFINHNDNDNKDNDYVERIKLYSTFDFDKIDTRIDTYINDAGDKYKMEHFEYLDPEELYLTEDIMNDMIRDMVKEVRFKITPAIIELIKLSYNIETEDDLIRFIYERVRMYVLHYSLEANDTIED